MLQLSRVINKPEYFFQPTQFLKRIFEPIVKRSAEREIQMPWGKKMSVNADETIGKSIVHFGVYDLVLTEALWRLVEPGMKVADIGANIGYFSQMLSQRVGPMGQVFSFEPHPQIFESLKNNVSECGNVKLHPMALSSEPGTMSLFIPKNFDGNEGVATLEATSDAMETKQVRVEVLDEVLKNQKIDIIKIDVEGHELSVLKGGAHTLVQVQHVLFEDFNKSSSPVIAYLKTLGFAVFRLRKSFWGPSLISVAEGDSIPLWEPPNYIATRDVALVQSRLAARGWHSLR